MFIPLASLADVEKMTESEKLSILWEGAQKLGAIWIPVFVVSVILAFVVVKLSTPKK